MSCDEEEIEFLFQYTQHLEAKIDDNFKHIQMQTKLLEQLVNKLM